VSRAWQSRIRTRCVSRICLDIMGTPSTDRVLIAQCQLEDATIVTIDRAFDAYSVPVLRAAA